MGDRATVTRWLGTVSAKRKAFGFIRSINYPTDVFFHSNSCADFSELAVGDAVEFSVEQQPEGKKAAVAVCKADQPARDLCGVDPTPHVGLVATDTASSKQSSGYLRYMDQQGSVRHLTFSTQDLSAGVAAVARGQLVQFHVMTDHRKQQQQQQQQQVKDAAAGGAAATSSKHAFMRATQLRPLSLDEEV
jgi:cold shock CspA family protein